jgi:hypothetical protein
MIFMEAREKETLQAIRFCFLNVVDLYEADGEKWFSGIRRPLDGMRKNHHIEKNTSHITKTGIDTQ